MTDKIIPFEARRSERSELEVKAMLRRNLAACIALLQKPAAEDDLERVLDLLNQSWGACAVLMMERIDP